MDEKTAVEDLREIKRILDAGKVRYWLDHGTLLGAVRDGKIIPWDDDIDLSVMSTELDKIIGKIPELEEKGFRVIMSEFNIEFYRKVSINMSLMRIKGDKTWMMMDVVEEDSSKSGGLKKYIRRFISGMYRGIFCNKRIILAKKLFDLMPQFMRNLIRGSASVVRRHWGKRYIPLVVPKYHYENLDTISFYNMLFNIPSHIEEHLSLRYGKDWKKPRTDWDDLEDGSVDPGFDVKP